MDDLGQVYKDNEFGLCGFSASYAELALYRS
jgi:hypothetical protein